MAIFQGSAVALVTPFTGDGLNLPEYQRLIDWQLSQGTDALVTCGTTGEPSTMTAAEMITVIEACVEHAAHRVPVIAGCGGNNTATCIEIAKKCHSAGADALLAVTPYYNKTTPQGMVQHFYAIADATPLPVIVYNVPSRTNMNVTPQILQELAKHPNIQGIKEASGDIVQISEMARLCPEMDLYAGNDDYVFPVMALGGRGVISASANVIPRLMHDICARWLAGDIQGARAAQFEANPLVKLLFSEVNPIPAKAALRHMGFKVGPVRLPLVELSEANDARLRAELTKRGLLPA